MDTLVDENLVDKDTVVDLLKNDVVLITPKDSKLGINGIQGHHKGGYNCNR